jgi:Tfp pilus assembly protein PilF
MLFFIPWSMGLCYLLNVHVPAKRIAPVLAIFAVAVLISFGHSTYLRNFVWKNEWTLWTDAAEKAPDQYRVHHNLGLYLQERGNLKEALRKYEQALISKEFHRTDEILPTHFQLAKYYADLGDHEKAKDFYRKVLDINSEFPQALGNLAAIFDREGHREKADEYLMRAMNADPDSPHINFNMGLNSLRNGSPREAFKYFKKAQTDQNLIQPSTRYKGICLKQMGWLGAASIHLNESVKLDPDDVIARLHLLEIFQRSGDVARAKGAAAELVASILKKQRLLETTLAVFSDKRESAGAAPDKAIVLPLLLETCDSDSERLQGIKGLLKTIAK